MNVFFSSVLFIFTTVPVIAGVSLAHLRHLEAAGRRLTPNEEASSHLALPVHNRGQSSQSTCCDRQPKKQFIGFGLDGEQLFVDVGQCRQTCSSHKTKIHRKEFEAYLKANASIDPVQLFLSLQQEVSPRSCGQDSTCQPTRTWMERHMTMVGVEQVAVVEDCSCVPSSDRCQRVERNVVYFPGTPFETVVDVGACSGPCQSGVDQECRSLRNKTVAIAGPNGDTCVEVIDKCSCATSCYRASSFEHVYDYTLPATTESEDEGPQLKVVDVGRCTGTCNGPHQKHHCVLRDDEDRTKCLMSLTRRDNSCVPLGYEVHRYRSQAGVEKSILSITDCGCQ